MISTAILAALALTGIVVTFVLLWDEAQRRRDRRGFWDYHKEKKRNERT